MVQVEMSMDGTRVVLMGMERRGWFQDICWSQS